MTLRTVKITNVYDDDTIEVEQQVELRDRDAQDTDDTWDAYLDETLLPLTGTGRGGDAGYFVETIDGLETHIKKEWYG